MKNYYCFKHYLYQGGINGIIEIIYQLVLKNMAQGTADGFPSVDNDTLKEGIKDKCGVLDKALLEQFQSNYELPLNKEKAQFTSWSKELVKRLKTSFIMAYNDEQDAMIIPEKVDMGEYNVCAHEMTHTLLDFTGSRRGLVSSQKYEGPKPEAILKYGENRVKGAEFNVVREQNLIRILQAKIVSNQGMIHKNFKEVSRGIKKMNNSIKSANSLLKGDYHVPVSNSQKSLMNASFDKGDDKLKLLSDKYNEVVNYYKKDFVVSISALIKEWKDLEDKDPNRILSDDFQKAKEGVMTSYEQLLSQMKVLNRDYGTYITEANLLLKEIISISDTNREEFKKGLEKRITDPINIDDGEKAAEVLELVKIVEGLDNRLKMFDITVSKADGEISDSNNLNNARSSHLILQNSVNSANKIIGNPEEVIARMVDSLYSIYLGSVDQNNFPLREADLNFLESMKYEGESIFKNGVSKYRLALKMQDAGIDVEKIRSDLIQAESYQYGEKLYVWDKTPFTIKGKIPFIQRVEDITK